MDYELRTAEPLRTHLEDLVHVEPDVIVRQGLVQLLETKTNGGNVLQ